MIVMDKSEVLPESDIEPVEMSVMSIGIYPGLRQAQPPNYSV